MEAKSPEAKSIPAVKANSTNSVSKRDNFDLSIVKPLCFVFVKERLRFEICIYGIYAGRAKSILQPTKEQKK